MRTSPMSSPTSSNSAPTAKSPERHAFEPMAPLRGSLWPAALLAALIAVSTPHARAEDLNDYPPSARADSVFGCMKANGETQELLQKCSCSIDVIASIVPYERYWT